MKELSLSLLSRGCGQLVSIHKDSGGQDGRVDVCLTPQDYYMWRYHGSALRLSNSGHLFGGTETALPKTYSTRRGPLVLYSQDLVCVATACHAEPKDRKRRAYQQTEQEVDQRLCTVSDLTEAIYYRNKQIIASRVTPSFLPPLRLCPVTDTRPVTPPLSQRRRSGFHLVLQTPRVSGLCTPQTESQRQLPNTREMCDVTRDTQRMGTEGRRMAGERDHGPAEHLESGLKTESEHAPWTPSQLPRVTFYEGHHPDHPTERTEPCPPPLCLRPMESSTHFETGKTAPSGPSAPITQEWAQRARRLPPIPENQDGRQETGAAERQPEGGKMRRGLLADKDGMILLELQREHSPPVGVLRSIAGRRGPGRQSALACFHLRPSDLQDALESGDRGVVRGMLPQELIEFDTGRRFGCLIMGPDGEIIQVSLNDDLRDNPHDPSQPVAQEASSHLDDVTQDNRVIQLLSPEGEKLPWVLILTPEQTHTEEGVVGNPDDPTDRITASHLSNTSHKIKKQARQIATDRQVDSSVTQTSKPGARQNSHLHKTTGTDTGSTNSHCETAPVAINLETTHPSSLRAEERSTGDRKVARQASRRHILSEGGGKEEGQEEKEEEDTCKPANRRSARQRETAPPPGNKRQTKSITRPTSSKRYSKTTALPPQEDTVEEEEYEEGDRKHTSKERRNKTHVNAVDDNKKKMRLGRGDDQPIRSKSDREGSIRKPIESQSRPSAPTRPKKTLRVKREDGGAKAEERGAGSVGEQVVSDRRRKRRSRKQKEVPGGEPIDIEKHTAAETEAGGRLSLVSGAARAWSASRETSCSGRSESETESDARRETDGETGTDGETEQDGVHLSEDKRGSVRSQGSRSSASTVSSSQWSFHRSTPSWEGAGPETGAANSRKASTMRDRMSSSCSTIMVPEEQLTLNPVRSESPRLSLQQQAAVARQAQQRAAAAQLVEARREEAERMRREREEQERKKQGRREREERMRLELEEDRKKREEEQSLSRLAEDEERRRREEQERERARREQEQRERERRRQEDKRRQMELLRRRREEEEQRRAAEHERQRQEEAKRRQEEERRREEESRMLLQMDETEREEYLRRQREEQEERRRVEMERRCREEETLRWAQEEARAQAELFFRQRLVLERQLAFQRGLAVESRGLDQTQDISRPWVYSYFTLLDLLGLSAPDPDNPDL